MRMIIDTDAGVDDVQAIIMALTHPGVTVEAITTVTGNAHVDKVVANVFTTLDIMGQDVPVYRGAALPLVADWQPEVQIHSSDGLGNYRDRPQTTRTLEAEDAVRALLRLADEAPGELTLVALGPLTNIALAIRIDESFPSKIKQFVFMGGTIAARGNTAIVTAEWNIFCDPEAAFIVLQAFPEATMLSWETTVEHPFSWDQYDSLIATDTQPARFFKATTASLYSIAKRDLQGPGFLLPDPLAMALILDPSLIRESQSHYVTVELRGSLTRGQTVIDYTNLSGQPANVNIVTRLDIGGVYKLFQRMLA